MKQRLNGMDNYLLQLLMNKLLHPFPYRLGLGLFFAGHESVAEVRKSAARVVRLVHALGLDLLDHHHEEEKLGEAQLGAAVLSFKGKEKRAKTEKTDVVSSYKLRRQ